MCFILPFQCRSWSCSVAFASMFNTGPARTLQSGVPASPSPSTPSPSSVIASSPSSNSCSAQLSSLSLLHGFVCDTRATHCPCQLTAGPVASGHIHKSMVYTPLFTSSLMTIPSRLFRVCGSYSSSTTTLPACTTFLIEIKGVTTFALHNFMHMCTPSTDLNGFLTQVLDPFSICCRKFLCCARTIQFHSREPLSWRNILFFCGSPVSESCTKITVS